MLGTKELPREKVEKLGELSGVIRVIEIVGTSKLSFDDAIKTGVTRAARTLRHISGVDVKHMTADVKDGEIVEYHADLKIAFALEAEAEDD